MMLDRCRDQLESFGFVYPLTSALPLGPIGQHNLAWEISGDRRFDPAQGTLADLLDLLGAAPQEAILSSEDFECALFHERRFAGFVERIRNAGREIVFIVYLRQQTDYAESLYMTMVLLGLPQTFVEFATEIMDTGRFAWREWIFSFCYSDLLARLEAIPGTSLIVRSYEHPRTPPLLRDFLSLAGLDPAALGVDLTLEANRRAALGECLSAFWQNRGHAWQDPIHLDIARALADTLAERRPCMSDGLHAAFSQRFAESNRLVCARYGLPAWICEPVRAGTAAPLETLFSPRTELAVSRLFDLAGREPPAPANP